MAAALGLPPLVAPVALDDGTTLMGPWPHGAVHVRLPAMCSHVVMTAQGDQKTSWRSGAARFCTRLNPHGVMLIPEGHPGVWQVFGAQTAFHVYLPDARLQAVAGETGLARVELADCTCAADRVASRILAMLSASLRVGDAIERLFVERAIDLLCAQLIRVHASTRVQPERWRTRGLADWQLTRVTDYMRGHLDQSIGLRDLAAVVGLSRFHFCTAFRLAAGRTPREFLTELRIGRARQLLEQRAMPIIEVAFAVGYQSASAFSATFRRCVGTTPREFRRGIGNGRSQGFSP